MGAFILREMEPKREVGGLVLLPPLLLFMRHMTGIIKIINYSNPFFITTTGGGLKDKQLEN